MADLADLNLKELNGLQSCDSQMAKNRVEFNLNTFRIVAVTHNLKLGPSGG